MSKYYRITQRCEAERSIRIKVGDDYDPNKADEDGAIWDLLGDEMWDENDDSITTDYEELEPEGCVDMTEVETNTEEGGDES